MLVMAQLREQVSNPEMQMTRKLPPVEREAKMRQLRARLPGVLLEHQLEPSHALLNLVAQMWETRQLQYIEIAKLTSREHEVLYSKSSKQLHVDADKLLVKEESKVPDQAASTELQVLEALKRRGVAFAFIDALSWEVHERYLQSLFNHLRTEAPDGYVKTTLQQLADRQVFLTMIRKDVNVRRRPDDTLEMDTEIMSALQSYEVGFHLMPLPKAKVAEVKQPSQPSTPGQSNQSFELAATWKPALLQGFPQGKPKDKERAKRLQTFCLRSYRTKDALVVDDHSRRLCFNFNLNKCQDAAHGAECSRGWHLCMKKGCHAPHSFLDHDKNRKP